MENASRPADTALGLLVHAESGRALPHRRGPEVAVYPSRWSFLGGTPEPEDARDADRR